MGFLNLPPLSLLDVSFFAVFSTYAWDLWTFQGNLFFFESNYRKEESLFFALSPLEVSSLKAVIEFSLFFADCSAESGQ